MAEYVPSAQVMQKIDERLPESPIPERASWGGRSSATRAQRANIGGFGPPPGWVEMMQEKEARRP